jgi:hypothetical protein
MTTDFRVLALDPGKTTGYCYAELMGNKLWLTPGEREFSMFDMAAFLETHVQNKLGHVVYEDFTFRNAVQRGTDLTPVKIIGVIELYAGQYEPMVTFTPQMPSIQGARGYYTDLRLKELGVYWAHGHGHARSATKHLLYWLNFGQGGQYLDIQNTPMELNVE